jgi:hypothetical protein
MARNRQRVIEGLRLAKAAPPGGARAASAFRSRPRSHLSRGAGAENRPGYQGFGRALEACGDQARPHWTLGALHKLRFVPAIWLALNGGLAFAVAPSHSSPPSTSTSAPSPSSSPSSPSPAASSPSPAASASAPGGSGPAPGGSAPAPGGSAPAAAGPGTASGGHVFYLSSCGLIRTCPPGQSANAPLVAVPY